MESRTNTKITVAIRAIFRLAIYYVLCFSFCPIFSSFSLGTRTVPQSSFHCRGRDYIYSFWGWIPLSLSLFFFIPSQRFTFQLSAPIALSSIDSNAVCRLHVSLLGCRANLSIFWPHSQSPNFISLYWSNKKGKCWNKIFPFYSLTIIFIPKFYITSHKCLSIVSLVLMRRWSITLYIFAFCVPFFYSAALDKKILSPSFNFN